MSDMPHLQPSVASREGGCVCKQWLRARELGIQVGQDLEELLQLYEHLPDRVENVLEIGTQHGGWLFMLAAVVKPPARFCAVDNVRWAEFDVTRRYLTGSGFDVGFILAEAGEARSEVDEWLDDEKLDVLHLDAHHDVEGVCEEWNLYSPLVRSGGIVVIHDVEPSGRYAVYGARELFYSLGKPLKKHLCQRTWPERLGIGVVEIP